MITSVTSHYLAVVIAHIGSQNRKLLECILVKSKKRMRTARSLTVSRSIRKGCGGSVPPRCRPPWIQTPRCRRPHGCGFPMDADLPNADLPGCISPGCRPPTWMQTPHLDADPPPGCRPPHLDAELPPWMQSPLPGCRGPSLDADPLCEQNDRQV